MHRRQFLHPLLSLHQFLPREGSVLAALFVAVLSLWGFIELADEVREGSTTGFDRWVVQSLRHANDPTTPVGPRWLITFSEEITALGGVSVLVLFVLAVAGYLMRQRAYSALALVLVATGGGTLLSFTLKSFFSRERPDVMFHLVTVHSLSFPSGHAMLSAVVYLTLGALLTQLTPHRADKVYFLGVAMAFTFLVGLSRVYLGVHYPTDVLAGWAVGLAWALLCWIVARLLRRRGVVESVSDTQQLQPEDTLANE